MLEDLDRFHNTNIFIKLRELNRILNDNEMVKQHVFFVYAINDDMFKDSDRTKFFDFLIPVIPIMNATNSTDKFLEFINNIEKVTTIHISDDFIRGVSSYINDIRILNNICNEFYLYKKIQNNTIDLKDEEMFSLIIYKNLYPNDFVNLQNGCGNLYDIFQNKKDFILKKISELNAKYEMKKREIRDIKDENSKSIHELRSLLLIKLSGENIRTIKALRYQSKNSYNVQNVALDIFFENSFDINLFYNREIMVDYIVVNNNNSIKDERHEISNDESKEIIEEFVRRETNVKNRLQNKIQTLKQDLMSIEHQKKEIETFSLQKLIEIYNTEIYKDTEICKEKIIIYLLRKGYIDEIYPNYLTYFYATNISPNDKNFILSIRNHEALKYGFSLSKIKIIINDLNSYEFKQKEILNFSLLTYLLDNEEKYASELYDFISVLVCGVDDVSNEKIQILGFDESFAFIDSYIQSIKDIKYQKKFIKLLCEQYHDFWKLLSGKPYSNEQKNKYLKLILLELSMESIKNLNQNGYIQSYIGNMDEFFGLFKNFNPEDIKNKLEEIIDELDIHFKHLILNDDSTRYNEVVQFIVDHNSFVINVENLEAVAQVKNIDLSKMKKSNLTTIRSLKCDNLINYIGNNLKNYLDKVFFLLDDNTGESYETIIYLLSDENIDVETKEKILKKESLKLPNLDNIIPELWNFVFSENKIVADWVSLEKYYAYKNTINETNKELGNRILMNFLNTKENYSYLTMYNRDINQHPMINEFIHDTSSSEEAINSLLQKIPGIFATFPNMRIAPSKIKILIKNNKLMFNVDIFSIMQEQIPECTIDFVKYNKDKYFKEPNEFILTDEQILILLKDNEFNIHEYNILISFIEEMSQKLADQCYNMAIKKGIQEDIQIPITQLKNVFEYLKSTNQRIKLLSTQIPFLNFQDISDLLLSVGDNYSKLIPSKGGYVQLDNNDTNWGLCQQLSAKGYIKSFKKDESKNIIRCVRYKQKNI